MNAEKRKGVLPFSNLVINYLTKMKSSMGKNKSDDRREIHDHVAQSGSANRNACSACYAKLNCDDDARSAG
jgi:hypothetical protein